VHTNDSPGGGRPYRWLAVSPHPVARGLRRLYHARHTFTIPTPRLLVKPALWLYVALREIGFIAKRVLICEPLFKAYCTSYGKRLRTGTYVHWVQGRGRILIGNDCWIDGKSTFTFGHRYIAQPTLRIGNHTGIGHGCTLIVGKGIQIGNHCLISGQTVLFDSSGHATDALERRAGKPPPADEVREIVIGDDVWIGVHCIIFPGVHIGEGSIVSAGSVVRTHVPAHCVVAGNPARIVLRLPPPAAPAA